MSHRAHLTRLQLVLIVGGDRVMTGFVSKRRIGLAAGLIAAYALVFNVVISSIVVSLSPISAADAHELCSSGGTDAGGADKRGHRTAIHCPLCVSHYASGDLPPSESDLATRFAFRAEVVYAFQERIFARTRSLAHRSRGPPGLI